MTEHKPENRAMVNRGDVWFCGFCDEPVGTWTRERSASSGLTITRVEPCGHEWVVVDPHWSAGRTSRHEAGV